MAVKSYNNGELFFTSKLGLLGHSTSAAFQGIADISLDWQRDISLYKPLDHDAPIIVKGKGQGKIEISGFAVAATDTLMSSVTTAFSGGTIAPSQTQLTLTWQYYPGGTTVSSSYTGYLTGQGIKFRKLAERTWVLDGVQTISLID